MLEYRIDNIFRKEKNKEEIIFQKCFQRGKDLPCFCYKEKWSVVGNCRMLIVEGWSIIWMRVLWKATKKRNNDWIKYLNIKYRYYVDCGRINYNNIKPEFRAKMKKESKLDGLDFSHDIIANADTDEKGITIGTLTSKEKEVKGIEPIKIGKNIEGKDQYYVKGRIVKITNEKEKEWGEEFFKKVEKKEPVIGEKELEKIYNIEGYKEEDRKIDKGYEIKKIQEIRIDEE